MSYEALLKNAPPHDTEAFIDYLKTHNEVLIDDEHYLGIANVKYDKPERRWITVFWRHSEDMRNSIQGDMGLINILNRYPDWEWRKKAAHKQTVPGRFHIHLIHEKEMV